jgi:hypothetical protein
MLGGEKPLWGYWCIRDIRFMWDQWMRCTITCNHGTYSGVSRGASDAIAESLQAASEQFRKESDKHEESFEW